MGATKIREAEEIDVIVDCSCGVSFRVYLPNTPYECPRCHNVYKITLSLEQTKAKDFTVLGSLINVRKN